MKTRTIEEIHDDLGNTAFALLLDNAIKYGRTITNIEEYDTKFRFEMDGYQMEFYKNWETNELIKQLQNGQKQ